MPNIKVSNKKETTFSSLAINSQAVIKGSLFVCLIEDDKKSALYINEAIKRKASGLILPVALKNKETFNDESITIIYSDNPRNVLAKIMPLFWGDMIPKTVIGVTGTNGKTSIAYLLAKALKGFYIGTLGLGEIDSDTFEKATHTTPEALTIYQALERQKSKNSYLVMECSSHALSQQRLAGIQVQTAIWTNLTHEHLDYHQTMENYFEAKASLFLTPHLKTAIINQDCPYGQKLILQLAKQKSSVLTFSLKNKSASLFCQDFHVSRQGMVLNCIYQNKPFKVTTRLLGEFNIENLLAVMLVFFSQGQEMRDVQKLVDRLPTVSGRLEIACEKPLVFIDYAHTPDALVSALHAIKAIPQKNSWCVFGCGGNRDSEKRALMAKAAKNHAKKVIVTSDNPRQEAPEAIIQDILKGFDELTDDIFVIQDRKKAIEFVMKEAALDDVVLIAGKGHEDYQILKDKTIHFSDFDEVKKCMV